MEQQKIYLLNPRNFTLKLIVSDGLGTITSLEYDYFGNNIYWINPVRYLVNVINLSTLRSKTILKGGSTYIPYDLVLDPDRT